MGRYEEFSALYHPTRNFSRAMLNTFIFLLIHIPLQIVVALGFALLLYSKGMFRGFFRAVYFLPVVVSGVVVTILWQNLYSFDSGVLNSLLNVFGIPKIPWLIDPGLAMPSIAIMATWKNVGIYIVLFLVGLQNIPRKFMNRRASTERTSTVSFSRLRSRCSIRPWYSLSRFPRLEDSRSSSSVCSHRRRTDAKHDVRHVIHL